MGVAVLVRVDVAAESLLLLVMLLLLGRLLVLQVRELRLGVVRGGRCTPRQGRRSSDGGLRRGGRGRVGRVGRRVEGLLRGQLVPVRHARSAAVGSSRNLSRRAERRAGKFQGRGDSAAGSPGMIKGSASSLCSRAAPVAQERRTVVDGDGCW